jgi:hypothetical protein
MGEARGSSGAGAPEDPAARDESGRPEAGDRRRFLLKAGAAGAAAWVAPVVLSSPAFAAQSGPPSSTPPPCIPCNSANVVNGSFENGLQGWTVTGTVVVYAYTDWIPDPPNDAGVHFAAMVDPSVIVGLPPGLAGLQQSVAFDRQCTGLPFTLSFRSGVAPPIREGENAVYTVQFTGPAGEVGDPFTLQPPVMEDYLHLIPQSIGGVVPDGATGVRIGFVGSDSAIDLVDFTICA